MDFLIDWSEYERLVGSYTELGMRVMLAIVNRMSIRFLVPKQRTYPFNYMHQLQIKLPGYTLPEASTRVSCFEDPCVVVVYDDIIAAV